MITPKEEFIHAFTEKIHRDGASDLLKWLEESTDFFTAPASTKYHNCHEGGLVEHSLNVYHRLCNADNHDAGEAFKSASRETQDFDETLAICGLLHDVCKANFYTVQMRNVKNDAGAWEKKPYYAVDEKFPFGHGEKSVFLIERFMRLSTNEAVAIRFHMGEFETLKCTSDAYSKYPLAVLLHVADLESTYIDEKEE